MPAEAPLLFAPPSQVSLVTYVFNDGELATGLLESVSNWTVKPVEIIVVDDGSLEPYVPPAFAGLPEIRLLRLDSNQGVGVSKSCGISAAQGDFILSMDCDMRVAGFWLEQSLPYAARPDTGIVGASVLCSGGKDLVSRYLEAFDLQVLPDGETDFLPGSIWLMRRAVWDEAGGFGGYQARTHEDHHFCARVKRAGFKLLSFSGRAGSQTRSLSRHDMIRRFSAWLGGSFTKSVRASASSATLRAGAYRALLGSLQRIELILKDNWNVAFVYFELLLFMQLVSVLFREAGWNGTGEDAPSWLKREARAFAYCFWSLLAPFHSIRETLRADLESLGWQAEWLKLDETGAEPLPDAEQGEYWAGFTGVFQPLAAPGGIFELLDLKSIKLIVDEDELITRNFSFYRGL